MLVSAKGETGLCRAQEEALNGAGAGMAGMGRAGTAAEESRVCHTSIML